MITQYPGWVVQIPSHSGRRDHSVSKVLASRVYEPGVNIEEPQDGTRLNPATVKHGPVFLAYMVKFQAKESLCLKHKVESM